MNWIFIPLNIVVLFVLIRVLYRHSEALKKYVIPAVVLKLMAGLGIGLLYKYYYGAGDTLSFFHEAEQLANLARNDVFGFVNYLFNSSELLHQTFYANQPRALFLVKILSVVNLVTNSSYWLSCVYFSLFSFAGMWFLARVLSKIYPSKNGVIALALFFVPSAVFWSSGIIKESIALGCLGFIAGVAMIIIHDKKVSPTYLLLMLFNAIVLWQIKYYYAGVTFLILISMLATMFITHKVGLVNKKKWAQMVLFAFFAFGMAGLVSILHPNFYPERFLNVVVANNNEFVSISNAGDYVDFEGLQSTWTSVITHAPKALFSGLFRPFLGESAEPFKIITGIENLALLLLTLYSFSQLPGKLNSRDFLLLISVIGFVIIMTVFLALSAPNFGTLIRYKSGVIPFFVLIITFHNPYIIKLMGRLF
ncbi:MAG TPA: hypothetical protein PKL31_07230 [Fulvivirga sp.]|nr:hypothetical protein [Fulvivirga sp.]